jgi:hypothetical protein
MSSCVVSILPPVQASSPGTSASPGFQYGRAGDVTAGTYLQVIANVPSSVSGNIVPFTGVITRAFITAENAATCTFKIQSRSDPGPVYTDLASISLAGTRKDDFPLSVSVNDGDEIVVLLFSGSCRNVQIGLICEQS